MIVREDDGDDYSDDDDDVEPFPDTWKCRGRLELLAGAKTQGRLRFSSSIPHHDHDHHDRHDQHHQHRCHRD